MYIINDNFCVTRCRPNGTLPYWPTMQSRPPNRPCRQCYRRWQTTTTDVCEQNNTGPLCGPVIRVTETRAYKLSIVCTCLPTLIWSICSAKVTFFHLLFNNQRPIISERIGSLSSFQDSYTYGWAWSIQPSFCDLSKDGAMMSDFWGESAKIGLQHSFCELVFHNGWENCNMEMHVNTANDLSWHEITQTRNKHTKRNLNLTCKNVRTANMFVRIIVHNCHT